MTTFRAKVIRGVTYRLEHLEPFTFVLQTGHASRNVRVEFGCHCFTEKLTAVHTADLRYVHKREERAFSIERHELSKSLPAMIQALGGSSVYLTNRSNYFFLRKLSEGGFIGPYLVFFNASMAKNRKYDVVINVESAYMKPNMADQASPVRFATLIEKTATGQSVPRGKLQAIKRK